MAGYVALLRGINVGGRRSVPMAELRAALAGLPLEDVQTYIQSGNVAFRAPCEDPARLVDDIEQAIAERFATGVTVLLRTADELAAVVSANPFLDRQVAPTTLLVTFLSARPDVPPGRLEVPAGETGELVLAGREVFVHTPGGYGRSKLGNAFVEKRLGVAATTRNWRSVVALAELARSRAGAGR
jgi:uncharacterized protein (DUF1697 family)